MYFRLMGKLNARRKGLLEENDKGFTLIELLVVVIIIGILAAIAIPVYLGVQNNAKDSAVKSDLGTAKTAIVAYQTTNATLPTTASSSTVDGYPTSSSFKVSTEPDYINIDDTHFIIVGTSKSGNTFCVNESGSVVQTASLATDEATCVAQ